MGVVAGLFADRRDAGARLGTWLRHLLPPGPADRVVYGLPRGGVVVAAEVALALGCSLDVLVVRKLGHPGRPELGLGALAETGELVLNTMLLARLEVPWDALEAVVTAEEAEAHRRVERYRAGRAAADPAGREAVVVDDGLATGYTARAAVASLRHRGVSRVVVAVPVGPPESVTALREVTDDVACLVCPDRLRAVGEAYQQFADTGDEEVLAALERARRR